MSTLAEQVVEQLKTDMDNVYDAGYQKGLKEIGGLDVYKFSDPHEVTGAGLVTCDYTHKTKHEIEVTLSSDTITDFSGVEVKVLGSNQFRLTDNYLWGFILKDSGVIKPSNLNAVVYMPCKPNTKYVIYGRVTFSPNSGVKNRVAQTSSIPRLNDVPISNVQESSINESVTITTDENAKYLVIQAITDNECTIDNREEILRKTVGNMMVNINLLSAEYEPYIEKTYIANADGIVNGIMSDYSSTINIYCDTEGVNIEAKYYRVSDYYWNILWDAIQNYGRPQNYTQMFSHDRWSKNSFKPKYDFVASNCSYMFMDSGMHNIKKYLEDAGVRIDISRCYEIPYMFYNSRTEEVPTLDVSTITKMNMAFHGCRFVKKIELLNIRKDCTYGDTFSNTQNLVEFRCTGTIGNNFGFLQSPLLSNESVQNIIDCLADLTGEKAMTLYFHADVKAKLTEEQIATITSKNWTLA